MGNNTSSTQRYQGNDPRQKLKSQVKNLIKELSRIDYSKISSKPRPWSGNLKQLQDFKNYENECVIFVLSNPTTTIRDPNSSGSRLVCDFLRTAALNNTCNNDFSKEKSSKNKQTIPYAEEQKLLEITNGRECHELNLGHREEEIPVSIPNLWFLYESKITCNLDLDDSLDYENDIQNNKQLDHDNQASTENLLKPTNPSAFKILTSNSQKIHDSTWRSRQIVKFGLANSGKTKYKSSEIVEFYHFENELLPDFTIVVSPERPSDRHTYVKVYEKIIKSSQMLIVTFSKEDVRTGEPIVENDVKEAMLFNEKCHRDKLNLFIVITDYFSVNTKFSYGQMNNIRSRGHSTNMFNSVPTTRTVHSTAHMWRMKTQRKRKLLPNDYYTKLCLKIQEIFNNKHSNIDERVFKLGELAGVVDDGVKSDDDRLTSVSELRDYCEEDPNIDMVQLFEEIEGRIESVGAGFSNYMHYVCVINFAPESTRG